MLFKNDYLTLEKQKRCQHKRRCQITAWLSRKLQPHNCTELKPKQYVCLVCSAWGYLEKKVAHFSIGYWRWGVPWSEPISLYWEDNASGVKEQRWRKKMCALSIWLLFCGVVNHKECTFCLTLKPERVKRQFTKLYTHEGQHMYSKMCKAEIKLQSTIITTASVYSGSKSTEVKSWFQYLRKSTYYWSNSMYK